MTIQHIPVKATDDLAGALEQIAASHTELLYVSNSGVIDPRLREVTGFAIRNKILSARRFYVVRQRRRRDVLRVEPSGRH